MKKNLKFKPCITCHKLVLWPTDDDTPRCSLHADD